MEFLSSRKLLRIVKIITLKMNRKIPPLPNRKGNIQSPRPMMELISKKIPLPQRYNSIQRPQRTNLPEQDEQASTKTPQLKSGLQERINTNNSRQLGSQNQQPQIRKNFLIRRPISARQHSERRASKDSLQSRESRGSSKQRVSPHYNKKMRITMPMVSAHSWVLYQMREERFLSGKGNFKRREIASLTKIMNLVTVLSICDNLGLQPQRIRVVVSKQASMITGTSAQLKQGWQLSLEDLFFGMMLPSGNDAAHLVAQTCGAIITLSKKGQLQKQRIYSCQALTEIISQDENAVGIYLHEMNLLARKIGLSRSHWASPHGLSNPYNLSSAEDVARLCMFAMKHPKFREVVITKHYTSTYYYQQAQQVRKGWIKWQNTNKMLWQGWSGIKTGITPNAGPCLAASASRSIAGRQYEFLVILIKSDSMQARWKQVRQLVDWIISDPTLFM